MDLVCKSCRAPHPPGTKFCTQCGTNTLVARSDEIDGRRRQSLICPVCRQLNTQSSKFCGNCSHPLADVELRPLSILFCDIVGSTALNQALGDETYNNEILLIHREICENAVHQYNGWIAEYLGDGIVAYFGYPEAHEDDARNAVLAGLHMVQSITRDKTLRRPFQVRVGVHSGLAFMSQGRAEGEMPSLASRIQDAAQPNTVLITEATQKHVAGFFQLEEQTARQLKGFSRASRLYAVAGVTGARSKLEARATKGLTPLVGREQEGKLLSTCWEKTKAGIAQTVLIRGEPGIGKSRVIEEFKKTLTKDAAFLLEGYSSLYQKDTAFAPISDCLKQAIGITAEDSQQEKWSKLNNDLTSVASLSTVSIALIAQVLSIPLVDPLQVGFTPLRQHQLTLEALMSWLVGKSRNRPLLMIVEDLHWTDPSTLELLSLIMSQQRTQPVMLVASYRPEFSHAWPLHDAVHEINLARLAPEQTTVVVNHVANNHSLPPVILQEVVERTDGVPLFVEEMTKTILESGYLKLENDAYELTGALPQRVIPLTVQDSLMARLDRLGPEKTLAQIGATLGREFRYDVLKAVAQAVLHIREEDLQHELERLVEAELMTRNGELPRVTYVFKHALIQDAAYESLLKSTQKQYHHQIAEVLERDFREVTESAPELLAQHFTAAGFNKKAIVYWEQAGQRALERAANREAIKHLEMALEAQKGSLDFEGAQDMELRLQLSLMPAHSAIRGWASKEVEACCVRARDLCVELGDHKRLVGALWGLWTVHFLRGELDAALEVANQVLNMVLAADVKKLKVMGHHAVGFTKYFRGELLEAKEHATEGIALFDLETEREIVHDIQFSSTMALRYFLSAILWFLGKPEESRKELDRVSYLIAELNHAHTTAAFTAFKLCSHFYYHDTTSIKHAAGRLKQLCEENGFRLYVPVGMMYRGWALAQDGEIEEGLELMKRGAEEYRSTGSLIKFVEVQVMYAEILWKAGRREFALRALEDGMAQASRRQEHLLEPELYRLRGEIQLEQGNEKAAAADFDRALEIARGQGALSLELRAVMSKGRLLRRQGKMDQASQELNRIYGCFTEGFNTKDLVEAKRLISELCASEV